MRTIHSKTFLPVLLFLGIVLSGEALFAQRVLLLDATNTVWRYKTNSFDPGYAPADAWVAPGFVEDSTWLGPSRGLFGQETAGVFPYPINTLILAPANTDPDTFSSYFRVHFNWTNAATQGVTLVTTNYVDDGLIVYLNGVEIYEFNTPPARPLPWDTATLPLTANPGGEPVIHRTNVVVNLLPGDNVIAVQLQQHTAGQPGSSDDVFGMWMYGVVEFRPVIVDPTQPTNRVVLQTRPTILTVVADASPAPTYQWFKNGTAIDPGVNATAASSSLVISNMASGDAGDYFAVVTNPVGSTNSRTATVGYMADVTPPIFVRAAGSPTFLTVSLDFDEPIDPSTAANPANYSIDGGLTIANAIVTAGGLSVLLTTASPQTPGTLYTVTILTGIRDLAGNPLPPNSTAQFRAWVAGCGGVTFETYNTGAGTAISALTNHATFPNSPDFRTTLSAFDIRTATVPGPGDPNNPTFYNTDARENYVGRLRGWFVAPESGPHTFYFASDDNGELWLSTDERPSQKALVARESAWSNARQWLTSGGGSILGVGGKRSAPINLQAGRLYYIEALYKEGGGGDNCAVAVQLPSEANPPADGAGAIQGLFLGSLAPPDAAGGVTISQQPASRTNEANTQATFTSVASNVMNMPICYQWQRSDDGGPFADIPGATVASYTTPYLTEADDDGDAYRVLISVIGTSVTSATATLKVTPDVTRPRVTRVLGINSTNIAVIFTEPMTGPLSTALDPTAYAIDNDANVQIGEVVINATNPLRLDIFLSSAGFPMTLGNIYRLRVSTASLGGTQIQDGTGNLIDPDPTLVDFRAQSFPGDANNLLQLPTTGMLPVGSLTDRGFAGRLVQLNVTPTKPNGNEITEAVLGGTYTNAAGQFATNVAPVPIFFETNIINYNRYAPTGAAIGRLVSPEFNFPGYTVTTPNMDSMTLELVTYLQLDLGIYRFGVDSDDGFRVSPATSVTDTGNSITIGAFNGGRGGALPGGETLFDFFVAQPGLYPFRLIWEQGNGGADLEWYQVDLNTTAPTYIPINANPPVPEPGIAASPGGGGPPAFTPPCTAKTLVASRSGANLIVAWPIAGGGNLFGLQSTPSLSPTITWSPVPEIPQNSAGNKRVTIPVTPGQNRFYRLYKAAPPNCP